MKNNKALEKRIANLEKEVEMLKSRQPIMIIPMPQPWGPTPQPWGGGITVPYTAPYIGDMPPISTTTTSSIPQSQCNRVHP